MSQEPSPDKRDAIDELRCSLSTIAGLAKTGGTNALHDIACTALAGIERLKLIANETTPSHALENAEPGCPHGMQTGGTPKAPCALCEADRLAASVPSTTRRTMTLPDVIGPVTPLVEEITERCGNMEGTESMQEVVAGVLNALVQTFEEWPQGFAPSATPRSIPVELCEKVVRRYTWMIDNPGAPIAGGVSFDAAMAELRTAVVIALHDPKPNNSPDGGKQA